ncbi:MAG: diamine N-acetyltransferase [Saprospiraceae bacterium]|jgi:diamine N-acetyltransferase
MIIKKYGIELHRLTVEDIELVRAYRNSDAIRSKMFFQSEISASDQKKWFETINNEFSYYFIIHWKGKKVGLIHGEIQSLPEKTTKGGVFFWDADVLASYIPVCTSVIMADLTFILLDMQKSSAIVRDDNNIALMFNKSLGYQVISIEQKKIHLTLCKEHYLGSKARNLVKRITKDELDLAWGDMELSDDEFENKGETILPYLLTQYKMQLRHGSIKI